MPDPTDLDRHEGILANQTDFGVGTLKAPIADNLEQICRHLGVWDVVVPVPGLFEQTLPQYQDQLKGIALLHADGDWYQSTWDIFSNLYNQVVDQGYVQVDDYGHWQGCKQAIHDFEQQIAQFFVLYSIDYTGVWFHKAENITLHRDSGTTTDGEIILLSEINLVLFPDWSQAEDQLIADLESVLREIMNHPQGEKISLIVSGELDYHLSEPLLTAAATNISIQLLEQGLEPIFEPRVSLVRKLNRQQWITLLGYCSGRLQLTHQQLPVRLGTVLAGIYSYSTEQLKDLQVEVLR